MRIWLDPEKMQARGLTPQDVIQSLQQQSHAGDRRPDRHAAGAVRAVVPVHAQRATAGSTTPRQFANVIVKTGSAGEITRVRDIGRVELGAQTYGQVFTLDGRPSAGLAIFQSPGANALNVGNEVGSRMRELSARVSAGT